MVKIKRKPGRILRRGIFLMVGCLLVLLLLGMGALLWNLWRDPLSALDRSATGLRVVHSVSYPVQLHHERRVFRDVVLAAPELDTIRITLSRPQQLDTLLPVILVLGGLEVGRQSLYYIPDHGNNIVVAYEYPYSPYYWYEGTPLTEVPVIRRAALRVPAQVLAVWEWLQNYPLADSSRMTLTGYSFGAMFVPAIYHLGLQRGLRFGPTVIVYGGTQIYGLLRHNMVFLKEPLRSVAAFLAAQAVRPLEPSLHLKALKGRFLLVNGLFDQLVPRWSWMPLQREIPGQKTILNLPEFHMHPDNPALTRKLVSISRKWLLEQGRINP